MKQWAVVMIVLFLVAGLGSVSAADTDTPTDDLPKDANKTTKDNKTDSVADLDSRLEQLISANDRTAFAASNNLDMRNQTVRVIIELDSGASLPSGYDIERVSSYSSDRGTFINAYVNVEALAPLAQNSSVGQIRPPERANPAQTAGETSVEPTPTAPSDDEATIVSESSPGEDGPGFGILTTAIAILATVFGKRLSGHDTSETG